jgi:hypothetical protein
MRNFPHIGVQIPTTYLPVKDIDPAKWAVIACDQFTSEPEYWEDVARIVGDGPSTLHLILPEVYLGTSEEQQRVQTTNSRMHQYLSDGLLAPQERIIYVERSVDGKTRRGLMLALDLEKYDFSIGSQSLIRATEGTILDRLPPRIRIRKDAPLELPHILVLIDDPKDRVIGSVAEKKAQLPIIYDFDLMKDSGHLCGRLVDHDQIEQEVIQNLEMLARPDVFYPKYKVNHEKGVLLFAVGDGNHSLATAKSIWEQLKPSVGMDHPARYALVEIENIHDHGLKFEPIHRVLFNTKFDLRQALRDQFGSDLSFEVIPTRDELVTRVKARDKAAQFFGLIQENQLLLGRIENPLANLAVGSVQPVLDRYLKEGHASSIDYVHGEEAVFSLASQPGNSGIYLPAMPKDELFRTVLLDGALPRKTFSMGEAHEKRFYMEARRITI